MSSVGIERADVVIVGAGLAGLAAAVALSGAGARVTLLDRKPYVGGRAYSYLHPALEEEVDSQHVMLGCCTNLIDLCKLAGADEHIRWYDRITYLEPSEQERPARQSVIGSHAVPAPSHSTLSFLRAAMLGMRDKLAIARGMMEFLRGFPATDEEPFSVWLKRTGQTELAIRHFWEPVVLATLNDTFERSSTRYVGKVMHEMLLRNAKGSELGIPTLPLSTFYAAFVALAETQGTTLRLRTSVTRLESQNNGVWRIHTADGGLVEAANVLLALPFEQTATLLGTMPVSASVSAMREDLQRFVHAPITTIHLWFDREVTGLHHAALLDTRIQWMFNKSLIRAGEPGGAGRAGQYLELTISGSFDEVRKTREAILAPALEELSRFFPKVREAKLVKSGVLKEARATFSVTPGLDRFRPLPDALGDGLFLAGDWTRTGWPSTMEGAVRSGRMAAVAISKELGCGREFVTPDLMPTGFMRLLARQPL
ncbi:MAG: hydroxysqualene dehydroxylase HpnE [Janthinobacterium lividum]